MPDARPTTGFSAVELIMGEDGCEKDTGDIGPLCYKLHWSSFLNNGYQLTASIDDPGFKILNKLNVDSGYFRSGMACKFKARCRLKTMKPEVENQTPFVEFYVTSLEDSSNSSDRASFTFTAVDKPSWMLNANPASGKAYRGSISEVIRQVVNEFAPGVELDIANTNDSNQNIWYTFRQSPKNMILRLMKYGSAILASKGRWVISSESPDILRVVDQSKAGSERRGFYMWPRAETGNEKNAGIIISYSAIKQNAWARFMAEVYSAGISTATGLYLDKVTDEDELYTKINDENTPNKLKTKVPVNRAFSKPQDSEPPEIGKTFIPAIPELYSAGEIGLKYRDYLSGTGRQLYLDNLYGINKMYFDTVGQGSFYDGKGLGSDTITLEFLGTDNLPFYPQGDWILHGFKHRFISGQWRTRLYLTRTHQDSVGKTVGQ